MVTLIRFLCLCNFLAGTIAASGQTYKITQFSQRDSLPKGIIHDVSQDSAGFMWIASDHGLFRYDGDYFIPVHQDTLTFLSSLHHGFLAAHRKAFKVNSYYPFEKVSLETVPIRSGGQLARPYFTLTSKGDLWWSDRNGIHSFKEKRQSDFQLNAPKGPSRYFISELGKFIVALDQTGQLFHFSDPEKLFVPVVGGNINSTVNDVLSYTDSTLIVATKDNLLSLKVNGPDLLAKEILYSGTITHITRDRSGSIWAATKDNHLLKFYPSGGKFVMRMIQDGTEPHRVSELRLTGIQRLFIDRHDNAWVCHANGLALVSEIPFVVVDPDLPNEIIRSVAFMDEGKAYLSGIAGFFETVDKGFNQYEVRQANLGKDLYPNAICKCEDRLWLGTVNDQLYYYEKGKVSKPFPNWDAINIFYMFCDKAGEAWVSRGQKFKPVLGIMKITADLQMKEYGRPYGFSTRMLVTRQDSRGVVYVAGIGDSTYLYRYDRVRDSFANLSLPMQFDYGENFEVHDFAVADDSTFWLASTAGLLILKGDSIRKVDVDELYGKEVVAVTLASDNVVWASTEKDGLIRYKSDDDYALFNIQAGLQSGIMWYRSLFTDSNGKLWAGSREGITVSSRPNPMAKKTETPVLLSVFNEGVSNIRKHVFNFKSNLTFGFVSLNYPTRSVEYQYKLNDGLSWRNLRLENKLTLPEMASGKYVLLIRSRQAGGYYWSDPLPYSFTILRPWYFSREAFLIYAVMLILLIVSGTRIYNRRLIREKNRLEVKVRERTHELTRKQEEVITQNQELHQLSEVLAANHENIVTQKEIIEKQNFLLSQTKTELERKVEERTHELKYANEELAQQNVQLEQFAFMTAHNLRSPVARLLGLTSLLDMNGTRDPQNGEILKKIRESSKNLDETIGEISAILHIKKGLHGSFSPVNLRAVWDRMIPLFVHEIEGNNIQITSTLNSDYIIRGIEPFVYSVFYNVVSNSIKYADNRKSSFIKVSAHSQEDKTIVIFDDNGIGFNSSLYADKLFKPFTRFNNIKEGRGLGLYLMKIQMEMMGGEIHLISHLDEGTSITLTFVKAEEQGARLPGSQTAGYKETTSE